MMDEFHRIFFNISSTFMLMLLLRTHDAFTSRYMAFWDLFVSLAWCRRPLFACPEFELELELGVESW